MCRKGPGIVSVAFKECLPGSAELLLCCCSLQLQGALLKVFLLCLSCRSEPAMSASAVLHDITLCI